MDGSTQIPKIFNMSLIAKAVSKILLHYFFIWAVILDLMGGESHKQSTGWFRFVAKETTSCLLKCA